MVMDGLTSHLEWALSRWGGSECVYRTGMPAEGCRQWFPGLPGMDLPISRCYPIGQHFILFWFWIVRLDSGACTLVVSQHVWWLKECPSGTAAIGWPPPAANAGDQPGSPYSWTRNTIRCGRRYRQSMPWSRVLPGMLPENISCFFPFTLSFLPLSKLT
jgi:hypothetical protein